MTMRRIISVLAVCSFVPACIAQSEYYVRFSTPAEASAAGAWQPDLMPKGVWPWYHLVLPVPKPRTVVADSLGVPLSSVQRIGEGEVERADVISRDFAPNDPFFTAQWHHDAIKTVGGYRHTEVSNFQRTIRVAVIDSGIWADHEDLEVAGGWCPWLSSLEGSPELSPFWDQCRHGSHPAGIMGAERSNNIGVAGVSPVIELYSLRCLDWCGGSLADVTDAAVIGAFYFECDILSVSLQWSVPYEPWTEACDLMEARGKYMVVSSGNFWQASVSQAAIHPWSIAVGAVRADGSRALFSNYGEGLDLVAPGVGVLSTMVSPTSQGTPPTSIYTMMSGTSMSCPMVTGVLANMLSVTPVNVDPHDIRADLLASCDPNPNVWEYGNGYLNATSAVVLAKRNHACLADLDMSGEIDLFDFLVFQDAVVARDPLADFTGDGMIGTFDWLSFQDAFVSGGCAG